MIIKNIFFSIKMQYHCIHEMSQLTNGIMAPCKVVGRILFTGNHLFRMKELPVHTGPDLIDHRGFQVDEYGPRGVATGSRFTLEKNKEIDIIKRNMAQKYCDDFWLISSLTTIFPITFNFDDFDEFDDF